MKTKDIERIFDDLIKGGHSGAMGAGSYDPRTTWTIAVLGKSILRLDRTSGRLAIVNICLTVVLAAIGIIQVYLMVKGH